MKFTPREIEGNVNVSDTHPLSEFAWLTAEIIFAIAVLYLLLGLATDLILPKIPVEFENWLGERSLSAFPGKADPQIEKCLRELLASSPAGSPLRRNRFTVRVLENDSVNAMALPGGHIVIFSGLLRKVQSENELAMVLGHELGHFAGRDHLKGLGRGLGLALAAYLFLGPNNTASDLASDVLLPVSARYSQKQEAAADAFGVDVLVARYGHAGGATDFFDRLSRAAGSRTAYIFASHPHPEDRISEIRMRIQKKGYSIRPSIPLKKKWESGSEKGAPGIVRSNQLSLSFP